MTEWERRALKQVHLLALPVPLWAQVQEHADELLREFALIAQQLADPAQSDHLPVRLTALAAEVTGRYGGLTVQQQAMLAAAAREGRDQLDELVFEVPEQAGGAAARLNTLLEEADAYCRSGRHLLTLAAAPEVVRFRRWYLGEFARQLGGAEPIPWPDFAG